MGLGKTIQTLALLVSRPSQNKKCKTTLIIAPVALLKQWEREIRKKLKPEHKLSVHIHHGGGKKVKNFSDLAGYDGE
jgi:SNF2 family DNA or RNA helicase